MFAFSSVKWKYNEKALWGNHYLSNGRNISSGWGLSSPQHFSTRWDRIYQRMNNIRSRSAEIINHEFDPNIVKSATDKKLVADFILYQAKIFSKKLFNLSMTVCFFRTLLEPPENFDIRGNILLRSVPVVFISPSLNEFSINFWASSCFRFSSLMIVSKSCSFCFLMS